MSSRPPTRGAPSAGSRVALILGLSAALAACLAGSPSPSPSASAPATPTAPPPPSPTPVPSPSPLAVVCPLSGLRIADPGLLTNPTIMVQIENNPGARPPANLSQADLVVEAPVEGDVTRYSAAFLCQRTIGLSGPIRSARYYNIDLWQDLHVLTVSFGASNGALARFREAGMPIINGIFGQFDFFTRGSGNPPHNLYGDLEALRNSFGHTPALDDLATRAGVLRPPFQFQEGATLPAGPPVASLRIRTASYWEFGWDWDAAQGVWQRIDGGEPLTDRTTGSAISARSVVVQRVQEDVVYGDPDPGGNARRYQHLVGSGDATLYVDGQSIPLHWSRPTAEAHTTWTLADTGAPLILPPGVVWWEVVPLGATVVVQ